MNTDTVIIVGLAFLIAGMAVGVLAGVITLVMRAQDQGAERE